MESKFTISISLAALLVWLFIFKNTDGVYAFIFSLTITLSPYVIYTFTNEVTIYKKISKFFTLTTFSISIILLYLWEINSFTIVTISMVQGAILILFFFTLLMEKYRYKNEENI